MSLQNVQANEIRDCKQGIQVHAIAHCSWLLPWLSIWEISFMLAKLLNWSEFLGLGGPHGIPLSVR